MWDDLISDAAPGEEAERVHSRFAPSALKRILACPRSVALSEAVTTPGKGSIYAAEGSVAHEVAEAYLRGVAARAEYAPGRVVKHEGFTVPITKEMHTHGKAYRKYVRGLMKKSDQLFVETTVRLDAIVGPEANMYGHLDAAIWSPKRGLLIIVDYKYGKGVKVSAIDNDQLKAYALGAMYSLEGVDPKAVRTIQTHVFQPRVPGDPGFDTIPVLDIMLFGFEVLEPVTSLIMEDGARQKPYVTGDHCRWCPAKTQCPALRDRAVKAAQKAFEDKPIAPTALSDDEIAACLDEADVCETWFEAVREEGLSRAEAGRDIRGRKLVPTKGKRVWLETTNAEALRAVARNSGSIYAPQAFKSVAQLEKMVPKDRHEALKELWTTRSSGNSLVKTSDNRAPVRTQPAHEVFASRPLPKEQ